MAGKTIMAESQQPGRLGKQQRSRWTRLQYGTPNWTKLKREVREAIEEVAADKGSPGMVSRIDIQIQRGAV